MSTITRSLLQASSARISGVASTRLRGAGGDVSTRATTQQAGLERPETSPRAAKAVWRPRRGRRGIGGQGSPEIEGANRRLGGSGKRVTPALAASALAAGLIRGDDLCKAAGSLAANWLALSL